MSEPPTLLSPAEVRACHCLLVTQRLRVHCGQAPELLEPRPPAPPPGCCLAAQTRSYDARSGERTWAREAERLLLEAGRYHSAMWHVMLWEALTRGNLDEMVRIAEGLLAEEARR